MTKEEINTLFGVTTTMKIEYKTFVEKVSAHQKLIRLIDKVGKDFIYCDTDCVTKN